MNVTLGHRQQALQQSILASVVGALTMIALYVAERFHPTINPGFLNVWATVIAASVAVRASLTYLAFAPTPAQMAQSVLLRCVPLLIVTLTAAQWYWCINLFIDRELTLQVLILFAGFLAISVVIGGMLASAPFAAILYLATAWPPFFLRLYQVGWAPPVVLALLGGLVLIVLAASAYTQVSQVRSILDRSDEIELLLERLRVANRDLTKANTQLDEMRRDATSELQARSIFFSSASHDFRQRLHAMKLLSRSAINGEATSKESNLPLTRLAEAIDDVETYVTSLLEFARDDNLTLDPVRAPVRLQDVFQQVDVTFEDIAVDARVNLNVRATRLVVQTDRAMLSRMVENLVSNAIKFSSGRKVLVTARKRGGEVQIQVWDQGPGIPSFDQSQIFTPFFQSSATPSSKSGVGLGLAVVKRFADCLGYKLSVGSRQGRGSVIAIHVSPNDLLSQQA